MKTEDRKDELNILLGYLTGINHYLNQAKNLSELKVESVCEELIEDVEKKLKLIKRNVENELEGTPLEVRK